MSVFDLTSGILPLEEPAPGVMHAYVYPDGSLSTRPLRNSDGAPIREGAEHDAPSCERGRSMFRPWVEPVQHHSECVSCGWVIARTLEDIADWLHWTAEHSMLGFEHAPDGHPVANAVLTVHGTGWAGVAAPGAAIRVDHLTLTGPMYLPNTMNGQPVPEGLADRLAALYGVQVERIPTIHELPGNGRRTPPVLSGEGYTESGRYGRHGGVGVLLHHDGHYLLGKRSHIAKGSPGTWAPPGGNRTAVDSDPWEDALLELDEETKVRPHRATLHGSVTYTEDGWSFQTIAATTDRQHQPRANRHALTDVGWFTADEMNALPLMNEFAEVLPDLLALFPEDE